VGFGTGGVRLGRGGGYHDRALAAPPAEPHDVPLDSMLTEDGVVWACVSSQLDSTG